MKDGLVINLLDMLRESPDTSLGSESFERTNPIARDAVPHSRSAILMLIATLAAPMVAQAVPPDKVFEKNTAPLADKADEGDDGVTMKALKAKGVIVKRAEKDLEVLKGVCVSFKSSAKFSDTEQVLINKLIADYKLDEAGSIQDKLRRILNYQKTQFAEYCDILFRLLAHVQILNAIECEGCYGKVLKVYFDAARLYTDKQVAIDRLLRGM